MTNKRFFTKGKILVALIALLFVMMVMVVLSTRFMGQAYASGVGVNPFEVTKIMYSGRPHSESIVVVLLGDAFTEEEYGEWCEENPNPEVGTVLYHAVAVMNTMLSVHPFNLFKDLFTVYLIHAHGVNPNTGIGGYLGAVGWGGLVNLASVRQARIIELASSLVDDINHIDMIQVIANSAFFGGFALNGINAHDPLFPVYIAVTPIMTRGGNEICSCNDFYCDKFESRTFWHYVFIHEFGHSFGLLADERDGAQGNIAWQGETHRANADQSSNDYLKWRHWFGHRLVDKTPFRFNDDWAVPAAGVGGCLMRGVTHDPDYNYYGIVDHGDMMCMSKEFCGVCAAELIRRMALLTGETFYGRQPNGDIPNTHTVTIADEIFSNGNDPLAITRILDSAFHGNTTLHTLNIPATITEIGDFAFLGATGLRVINNFSMNPQPINLTTFAASGVTSGSPNQLYRNLITVNVPFGVGSAFMAAPIWQDFTIVESLFSDGWVEVHKSYFYELGSWYAWTFESWQERVKVGVGFDGLYSYVILYAGDNYWLENGFFVEFCGYSVGFLGNLWSSITLYHWMNPLLPLPTVWTRIVCWNLQGSGHWYFAVGDAGYVKLTFDCCCYVCYNRDGVFIFELEPGISIEFYFFYFYDCDRFSNSFLSIYYCGEVLEIIFWISDGFYFRMYVRGL